MPLEEGLDCKRSMPLVIDMVINIMVNKDNDNGIK